MENYIFIKLYFLFLVSTFYPQYNLMFEFTNEFLLFNNRLTSKCFLRYTFLS